MAIDTAEKRRSISGLPFLTPGVTPNAGKDQEWRQEAGWGYSGILVAALFGWSWAIEAYLGGSWVNISEDVMNERPIKAKRGMAGVNVTDRVAAPGDLSFTLDNSRANSGGLLGYYSPDHASLRSGFVLDALVRLKITSGSTTRYVFRGWISTIFPTAGQFRDRLTFVQALDYMHKLNLARLSRIMAQENQRSDQIVNTLITSAPTAPQNTSYATDNFAFTYALHSEKDEKTTTLAALSKVCKSALGYVFIKGNTTDGETLVYQYRHSRAGGASLAALTNTMSGLKVSRSSDTRRNKVVGAVYPVTLDDAATTVLCSLGNEMEIFSGAANARTFTLRVTDPNGGGRRISGKEFVTPLVADTHYKMSSITNDNGNDLNAYLSITLVLGANSVEVTLENTGSAKGYVNKLEIVGRGIYTDYPIEIVVESGAGDKEFSFDLPYQDNYYRGVDFITAVHKFVSANVSDVDSLWFYADFDTTLMGYALALDIGDRITLTETATGLSQEYFINWVEFTIERGMLKVAWGVVSTGITQFFTLDHATYGELNNTTYLLAY